MQARNNIYSHDRNAEIRRNYVVYYLLAIVSVFVLSCIYEFWIERNIFESFLTSDISYNVLETTVEHWEYVFTITIFSAIALLFPFILACRLNLRHYQSEADKFKLKTQLKQADKLSAIGTLAASIAHELKNPLIVVTNYIRKLNNKVSLTGKETEFANIAEKECQRMLDFIEELQGFNRTTSGQLRPLDFHECLNNVLLICSSNLRKKNIFIEKRYAEKLPKIIAVKDQVCQVLINLINNAVDACKSGGNIKINTNQNGKNIELIIQDNGIGIKKEDISHIFEPFFTTKPASEGTGLGLYVSHGIITNHGGTIEVKSEESVGTAFTINLPASKEL